ncbi:MAG: HD-GYP domain-containing protein [Gemmatimonadaceae bacterium]|nr:HD-GYP domain-containing protein [Gemmatimonadaceae bacterium]MCW5826730.1 HD-GYP domain-containing protein [Gemmatimonadaceae bacterium]
MERIVEVVVAGAMVSIAAFFALGDAPSAYDWQAAGFFTGLGILAAALSYPVGRATSGTIGFLPYLSISIIAPNLAAVLSVAISTAFAELIQKRARQKAAFNIGQHTFAIACGIWVYHSLGGTSVIAGGPRVWPFLGLAATYFALNKLAVSTVVAKTAGDSVLLHWLKSVRGSSLYDALSLPLVVVLSLVFVSKGAAWTAVAALPMLGIRQLYRMVFALEKINEELLQLMVASIEARDPYTSGHSQRVARYAREIARSAGLSAKGIERVEMAALLHDVGKIHEEFATILRKPGRLTVEEFARMKLHPVRSADLVAKVSHFRDLVAVVRAHHEAWNGTGYPDQLHGDAIPHHSRIIAIADTVDAMTTSRPYRAGMTPARVREELAAESGRQFDPRICAALLAPANWTRLEQTITSAQAEFPANESGVEGQGTNGNTGEFVSALVSA